MSIGKFVVSLDFELMWGMNDVKTVDQYGENIRGVHQAMPRLLQLFEQYGIRATFSTVGFLFFESRQQLLLHLPTRLPEYTNPKLSPYTGYFDSLGETYHQDPYHYAPQLIRLIQQYPQQEIGTHTFSHYYCLEEGQTKEDFRADIIQAQKIATKYGISFTSLVFPRNQFNDDYLQVCKELGIICIRGNETSWIYKTKKGTYQSFTKRGLKLLDTYVNISGYNCYSNDQLKIRLPINIPASSFLRPYKKKLKLLDGLRLRRIKSAMTYAAANGLTFHLWWHPHNFGVNHDENFSILEQLLKHFNELHIKYNFESHTMTSAAKQILNI